MRSLMATLALAPMIVFPAGALACPAAPPSSATQHVAEVDTAFRGRALSSMPDPASPGAFKITTFGVTAPLKMLSHWSFTQNIAVRHPIADEQSQNPIRYEIGAEALVAARVGADGVLYTSSCDAPRWPENDYRAALYLAPAP